MTRPLLRIFTAVVFAAGLAFGQAQQVPNPHEVPVMDGGAGPCAVAFTVTDLKGDPPYDARIRVHIEYGFAGVRQSIWRQLPMSTAKPSSRVCRKK
jgi:hypothetical protein